MRALLIQTKAGAVESARAVLSENGWIVVGVEPGTKALRLASSLEPDLIAFDIGPSELDWRDALANLRAAAPNTPLIVLSERDDLEARVSSLHIGADDYIQAPLHAEEFMARIQALARRSRGFSGPIIQAGPISVDLVEKTVFVNGACIFLTQKEYAILELLSLRIGETVNKEDFLDHLYSGENRPDAKIVDVFVARIRKKLAPGCGGESYIDSVYGKGYSLRGCRNVLAAA